MSASVPSATVHASSLKRDDRSSETSCSSTAGLHPQTPPEPAFDAPIAAPCLSNEEKAKLSPKQIDVLEILAQGSNVTEAARRAQVSRHTIYRWLNLDPVVRCAYNRWKRLCEQSAEARLLALQQTALDVVAEELESKRNGKLAAMLLDRMGILRPATIDATTIQAAEKAIELERQEQHLKLSMRGKQISHERVFMDKSDWFEGEEGER